MGGRELRAGSSPYSSMTLQERALGLAIIEPPKPCLASLYASSTHNRRNCEGGQDGKHLGTCGDLMQAPAAEGYGPRLRCLWSPNVSLLSIWTTRSRWV